MKMSEWPTTSGLARYRSERTIVKSRAVKFAAAEMLRSGVDISISSVARHAQVSRAFIHENQELHDRVQQAASEQKKRTHDGTRELVASSETQLRAAERKTFVAQIKELKRRLEAERVEVKHLKIERSKWFGGQIDELTRTPEDICALQDALQVALSERDELREFVGKESDRADRLERSLEAVRAAYKQDYDQSGESHSNVIQTDRFRQ